MKSIFDNSVYSEYGNGMQYSTAPQANLTWTQALTAEEEKILHKAPSTLSLEIPKEDMLRAKCTHRDPKNKKFTIKRNDDGSYTCLKCGATFNIVDKVNMDQIREVIGGTIDILQTAKMAYIDMTPEAIQTYFIILPFLEIAPKLYEAAVNTLSKVNVGGIGPNGTPTDTFSSLYGAVGNAPMMNPQMMAMWNQMLQQQAMMGGGVAPMMGNMAAAPSYNPMQTGGGFVMPGVVDSTATVQSASTPASNGGGNGTVQTTANFELN